MATAASVGGRLQHRCVAAAAAAGQRRPRPAPAAATAARRPGAAAANAAVAARHPGACSQRRWRACFAAAPGSSSGSSGSSGGKPAEGEEEEEFVGLLPEEDEEIPGTYFDALNKNTRLGKAVASAIQELETLGDLEAQQLEQADALLKKLGMKGSLFGAAGAPPPPKSKAGKEGEEEEEEE